MPSIKEPRRIGTFEQVGHVFDRKNSIREPVIVTIAVELTADDFQRFNAAHASFKSLSREAFARKAISYGLPRLQEQAMAERSTERKF